MSGFTQATKAKFRRATLKGFDLLGANIMNELKVFETILKPYHTAQVKIIDNIGLLENKDLKDAIFDFAFDGNRGPIYEGKLRVLSFKGEKASQSLRTINYTIELIGEEYFNDKKNMVQQSFQHIPGTDVIQKLHQNFLSQGTNSPLRILSASLGAIAKESHIISSVKPMKAISDIRNMLNYAKYKSGNTLYFKDALGHVLGPLEQLFDELQPVQEFHQSSTWGKSFLDLARVDNAIISAIAEADFSPNGRGGNQDTSSVAVQEKMVFDMRLKKLVIKKLAGAIKTNFKFSGDPISLIGDIFQGAPGGHGGVANYRLMDSANMSTAHDGSNKAEEERVMAALYKNGPVITAKVPIQSGMQCTVGKGVKLNLQSGMGDLIGRNVASGNYLVHSLCHRVAVDDRLVQADTTLSCARGSTDA